MASSHLLFPRREHFSCNPPLSVRDDYGNCIDFVNQKWDLQGPRTLLLAGFIVSVLAGCWTLVFFGSEGRARKRASSSGTEGRARKQASSSSTQGWFKSHSIVLAMAFALCYFIVDAYLRFLQFQQRSLNIGSILLDLARTKPKGASDYIVLMVILFNNNIHTINGTANEGYFKVCRKAFFLLFTVSDLASAVGDIYTRATLAIEIGSKGDSIKYLEVIPHYVTTILSSFDTLSYGLTCLAGIYFIMVALKSKARSRDKISKGYLRYFTLTAVAFLVRSIPGLVLCIISDWFGWTRTYGMDLLDNAVYAVSTCMIFYFWTRLAKTPIDTESPKTEYEQTSFIHSTETGYTHSTETGYTHSPGPDSPYTPYGGGVKQAKYVRIAVNPVRNGQY